MFSCFSSNISRYQRSWLQNSLRIITWTWEIILPPSLHFPSSVFWQCQVSRSASSSLRPTQITFQSLRGSSCRTWIVPLLVIDWHFTSHRSQSPCGKPMECSVGGAMNLATVPSIFFYFLTRLTLQHLTLVFAMRYRLFGCTERESIKLSDSFYFGPICNIICVLEGPTLHRNWCTAMKLTHKTWLVLNIIIIHSCNILDND